MKVEELPAPATFDPSRMSVSQPSGSALTREAMLRALSSLSEELRKVKTQYLVEGLFEEGKI